MQTFVKKLQSFLRMHPQGRFEMSTAAIGDGEWTLVVDMVYDEDFSEDSWGLLSDSIEFIGSNGTQEEADDLWAQWDQVYFQATGVHYFNEESV